MNNTFDIWVELHIVQAHKFLLLLQMENVSNIVFCGLFHTHNIVVISPDRTWIPCYRDTSILLCNNDAAERQRTEGTCHAAIL